MKRAAKPDRTLRAQRYRLALTSAQAGIVSQWQAGARWFYNEAARSQRDRSAARTKQIRACRPVSAGAETGFSLSYAVRAAREASITYWHDGAEHLLAGIPAGMLHGALGELDAAWKRHFSALKDGRKSSAPGFRSRAGRQSLRWQCQVRSAPAAMNDLLTLRAGHRSRIRLPGAGPLGEIKVNYHRDLPADALVRYLVLLTDPAGRHWLVIQYETATLEDPAVTGVTGIDRGIEVTAVTSEGAWFATPDLTPGQRSREVALSRSLARKRRLNPCSRDVWVTGPGGKPRLDRRRSRCPNDGGCHCWKHSRRYQETKREVQLYALRREQVQSDAEHKASRVLARGYAVVVMEDLDVSAMTGSAKGTEAEPGKNVRQKAGLNRGITRSRWYALEQKVGYKTSLVKVPPRYTSQACPECGLIDAANRPERDRFACTGCGYSGHADVVAAINIRLKHLASSEVTAPASGAEAREIREPGRVRPANSHQSVRECSGDALITGQRSHAGQEPRGPALLGVSLIPEQWGLGTARTAARTRRSRWPDNASRRNAGPG